MIISLNWLKKYVKIDVPTEELVALIGARLVEVESTTSVSAKYAGAIVVKVVSAEKIEKSDKLHLCYVDDGGVVSDVKRREDGLVQVVCGCPNVRAGMLAVWLSPGAVVPETWGTEKELVLATRKLAGYESNGMLAGPDEMGLGEFTEYLAEVDPEMSFDDIRKVRPGDTFVALFGLDDEVLLDIENKSLTHRPDTFGIIGFAREVAGILGKRFDGFPLDTLPLGGNSQGETPSLPSGDGKTPQPPQDSVSAGLSIEIADSKICPRYTAAVLEKNEHWKPGRYLTREAMDLALAGMRPIDFVVDWTNELMLLTGQPLHAFDYDKLVAVGKTDKPKIIVRNAKNGEKMELLDGRTIEMDANDIVITSNGVPVALAGAMGAKNTVIDENTKRIVVESATFSLYNLRRTQMKHGIFSEAITRFTKGQPAELTRRVLDEYVKRVAPGYEAVSEVIDSYPVKQENPEIKVSAEEINGLLGSEYSVDLVMKTLTNVGFRVGVKTGSSEGTISKVKALAGSVLLVTAPWWRTDIHIREDVIEEVGRMLGYDNIRKELPARTFKAVRRNAELELMIRVRDILSRCGANEVLTYSFAHGDLLRKVGQDEKNSYRLVNSISPDLELIRQSILPSLLDKVSGNVRDGYSRFALFEMNAKSQKSDGLTDERVPVEAWKLALVYTDEAGQDGFYQAKALLDELLYELGVKAEYRPMKKALSSTGRPFELDRSAEVVVEDKVLGLCGELKRSVQKELSLPEGTAGFEIGLETLIGLAKLRGEERQSRYPSAGRDLTLQVPVEVSYEEALRVVEAALPKELWATIDPVGIYQGEDKEYKNVTWHLEVASYEKTLTSDDTRAIMEKIGEDARDVLGAKIV